VQLDPITLMLKAPEIKGIKLEWDESLSGVAFNFYMRRYNEAYVHPDGVTAHMVGRCSLNRYYPS